MDWGDKLKIGNVAIHCTPAQHGTARGIFDRDAYLWCSYVIESQSKTVFFAGDTGYRRVPKAVADRFSYPCNPEFKLIGNQFDIDVALLPIGAYSPRYFMSLVHTDPIDAACLFKDLKAKHLVPMHYGTFRLTDELPMAPIDLLKDALGRLDIDDRVLAQLSLGGTLRLT